MSGFKRLLEDSALRTKLSSKARPHAERYFSLERCVADLSAVYERICGRPMPGEDAGPLSYGLSPLGYLQAGNLTDPASIAYHILTGGVPEEFDVHIFRFFVRDMRCMLDVGANIGLYCCIAAHESSEGFVCHAFEPQPECERALLQTVSLNNWENRLFVHAVGLSDKDGEAALFLSGTGSSFDAEFNCNAGLPSIQVPIRTLDAFSRTNELVDVDFVKIDVEGLELAVLRGGEQVFATWRPVLFVEIADRIRGRSYRNAKFEETLLWLDSHGYDVFKSTEDGCLRAIAAHSPGEHEHLAMYLCLPKEKVDTILPRLDEWCARYRRNKRNESAVRRMRGVARKLKKALGHPAWVFERLAGRLGIRRAAPLRPATQDAHTSFHEHDAQLRQADALQKNRLAYARVCALNLFDSPSHRHGALLRANPSVRRYAIDIGSGAGWLSARLHYEFETVYSVEPSEAGHALAESLYPVTEYENIVRISGFAENVLQTLKLDAPAFFVHRPCWGTFPIMSWKGFAQQLWMWLPQALF